MTGHRAVLTTGEAAAADNRPLLLVTTGTDHHPFDRLVRWVDAWLLSGGQGRVRALVQYATAPPPLADGGVDYLTHSALQEAISTAAVVLCHAGATVIECRQKGIVPIVVPRLRALGEVVDDHQVLFARRLAADGVVICCESEQALREALEAGLACPSLLRSSPERAEEQRALALRRAGSFLDGLVQTRTSEVRSPGPTVAYLGGLGRSGSTLLERLLDRVPGVTALGEVTHLWERGLRDDERCGCGEAFSRCPFWIAVGQAAWGGWDHLDVQAVLTTRNLVDRTRYIPQLMGPLASRPTRRALTDYVALNRALHAAAAQRTGATVVVDSSKRASLAHALHRGGVDLRVVHVVRDPRGVAYSWGKRVPRPEAANPDAVMPVYSAQRSSWMWNAENLLLEALPAGVPRLLVRYEDLVSDPAATLRQILVFLGLQPGTTALGFLTPGGAQLATNHLVAGNPMRFQSGLTPLQRDDAWRDAMPVHDQHVVERVTGLLRRRYGYERTR